MKRFVTFVTAALLLGCLGWILWYWYQNQNPFSGVLQNASSNTPIIRSTHTLTPYQPLTDTPTQTPSPSATNTLTPSSTPSTTTTPIPSFTPTASRTPIPTSTPTPLIEAQIDDIRGRWPAFSLDCEARSAVDWAAFFGTQIDEIIFFNALPASDNPNRGFVGNVHAPWGQTPPGPYGVYAGPVAKVLRSYGLKATPRYQMTFDELRGEISAGRPVIVWVVGRVGEGTPKPYTSSDGETTTVARFEHTVIVIGYTQKTVTVLDGYWVYNRQVQDFLNSWGVLENMAIVANGQ